MLDTSIYADLQIIIKDVFLIHGEKIKNKFCFFDASQHQKYTFL